MAERPTGTVTFLFTDIEASTQLWEHHAAWMRRAHRRYEAILRATIAANGGWAYKQAGDAFQAAFQTAPAAVSAAVAAQEALAAEPWGEPGPLRVRMALHTGATEERPDDYVGPLLNRVARLMAAGHGGQVLLTTATSDLVGSQLPPRAQVRDLGEHRLKDLLQPERVWQVVINGLAAEFPPLITIDAQPHNLPAQTDTFIGREEQIAELQALLRGSTSRLLTLTGPGGSGKTRLALQVAAAALPDFADGIWFVDLASLRDPALVLSAIARVLKVHDDGTQPLAVAVKTSLRDKQLALVLDNFEQVVEAAPAVSELLQAVLGLKTLVTSRVSLRLQEEWRFVVPPLALPDQQSSVEKMAQTEAVRLFMERAPAVHMGFALTEENGQAVAAICRRLDGLPLALELAAAALVALSPSAMQTRLGRELDFLAQRRREAPARQQTLRTVVAWSYDLLGPDARRLFHRLAAFSGGSTLEGIEEVCRTADDAATVVLDGVAELTDLSLLRQQLGVNGDQRYRMLETIHTFAQERLEESGEESAQRMAHARFYMRLAEEAEPHLTGDDTVAWLDRLEADYENIRAALAWACEQARVDTDEGRNAGQVGMRTAAAFWRFWLLRGLITEGRDQLDRIVSMPETALHACSPPSRARSMIGAASLAWLQGDQAPARNLLECALALAREAGDTQIIAHALHDRGVMADEEGDLVRACSLYEESLGLARELGDRYGVAANLRALGTAAKVRGDYGQARALYHESLAIARELGAEGTIATLLGDLGALALEQDDLISARRLFMEGITLRRQFGDKFGIAASLSLLGHVAFEQGDYTTAGALYEEALILQKELGDKPGIACSLSLLGNVAFAQEDSAGARALQEESLALRIELEDKKYTATCLVLLGAVAIQMGAKTGLRQVERGARMLGAGHGLLRMLGMSLDKPDRWPSEWSVKYARTALGNETFERLWQEGQSMNSAQAVAYALRRQQEGELAVSKPQSESD